MSLSRNTYNQICGYIAANTANTGDRRKITLVRGRREANIEVKVWSIAKKVVNDGP